MFTGHDETALRTGQGERVGPMTYPSVTEITPRPEPVTPDPFIDCLVDDAQWLDPASSQILGFCPRRTTLAA